METYLRRQLAIAACLYIGQMTVGYIAWSSPVIAKLKDPDETPLSEVITDSEGAWMGSFSFLGTVMGGILSGWFSNLKGRKLCLLLGGMMQMTTFLLLATSKQMWMMMIGRCVNGVGLGIIMIVNMTYIAEISSTNIRGILLTGAGTASTLGTLLAYSIGPFISYVQIMYTGFFVALAFSVGTLLIPETPAFYVLKGKEIEAKTILQFLDRSKDIEDVLTAKISKTKPFIQEWKDVFLIQSNRRALFISSVLFVCQQLSGAVVVMLCATSIFQSVDSSIDPAIATIVMGVTQVSASCVSPLFVERVGRKPLMVYSTAVGSVSLAILGVYFYLEKVNPEAASQVHWLPLLTLVIFLISYQGGFGVIPNTCMSEMFDSSARGPGSAIVLSVCMIVGFTVTATFGYMITTFGSHVTFLMYSAACACASVFSSIFMVETKGKSLTEIQYMLSR